MYQYRVPQRRTQALARVPLQLPPVMSLSSSTGWEERGKIMVLPAGKAPKFRFKPGEFVRLKDGRLYEILYVYRIQDRPSEWLYCCEERQSLTREGQGDYLLGIVMASGAGSKTPRLVREIFADGFQAYSYFVDIPGQNRNIFTNQQLVKGGAQVVSSGEVLEQTPGTIEST